MEKEFSFKRKENPVEASPSRSEFLDIVDENDNVIGTKRRSEVYAEKLHNYRVVNVFIVNSEGKIWIPRRTANMRIFPSALDMSMGAHVESGETYEDTLKRKVQQELNIDTDAVGCEFKGKLLPQKDGVSSFMQVYEIHLDEAPKYNEKEFTEDFWLRPEEVLERLAKGDTAKSDLPILLQRFYGSKSS